MSRLDDAVAEAIDEVDDDDDLAALSEIRESADDAPVIKLVNSLIAQAVEEGASDIHFEPMESRDMRVRYRIDGVLAETTQIPKRMNAGVVSRVKIMADLDIAERRLPQDGRVSLRVEGHAIDVRVVTHPGRLGRGHRHAPPRQGAGAPVDGHARHRRRLARAASTARSGSPTARSS